MYPEVLYKDYYAPNSYSLDNIGPFKMVKNENSIKYICYDLIINKLHTYTQYSLDTTVITRIHIAGSNYSASDITPFELQGYRFTGLEQTFIINGYKFVCYKFESVPKKDQKLSWKEYRYVDKKSLLMIQSDIHNIKTNSVERSYYIGRIEAYR